MSGKKYLFLINIIFTIILITGTLSYKERIYGGQNATSGQFPFMVVLNDPTQYCSGVIIGPSWILTAGHCLYFFSPDAEVYIGSHLNKINGTSYKIRNTIVHGDFNDWSLINDIGLIHLNSVLQYNDTVEAIELGGPPGTNATCTVIGWGQTETEWMPQNLKYVEVTSIDLDLCRNITDGNLNGHYLGLAQVCTLGGPGRGACWGDDGGALICDGKLAGIFSYTLGDDCSGEMTNVYTNIAAYTDWIQQETQK